MTHSSYHPRARRGVPEWGQGPGLQESVYLILPVPGCSQPAKPGQSRRGCGWGPGDVVPLNGVPGRRSSSLLLSRSVVSDSATLWTAARLASLSFTIIRSLLRPLSIESVMPSNHLCRRFSFCLQSFPASGSFPMSQLFASGGQHVGASSFQHQSFQ